MSRDVLVNSGILRGLFFYRKESFREQRKVSRGRGAVPGASLFGTRDDTVTALHSWVCYVPGWPLCYLILPPARLAAGKLRQVAT